MLAGVSRSRPRLVAGENVEEGGGLCDGARQHTYCNQRVVTTVRAERNAFPRSLEPDEAAAGGGDAQRASPVAAVGHRDDTGGDRGGRPTRGPTRGQRGIPGVAGWSAQARLRCGQDAKLWHRGAAHGYETGHFAPDRSAVVVGDVVFEEARADTHGFAPLGRTVLYSDWNASEGTRVIRGDRFGRSERPLGVDEAESVDAALLIFEANERGLDELASMYLTRAEQFGELQRRGPKGPRSRRHDAQRSWQHPRPEVAGSGEHLAVHVGGDVFVEFDPDLPSAGRVNLTTIRERAP